MALLLKPKPRMCPKPARPLERKRLTIIAGFQCPDGVLMCSDTEETLSTESKVESDKMKLISTRNAHVLCGGAGDSANIELAMYRLEKDINANSYVWGDVEGLLNCHAQRLFTENIVPLNTLYSEAPLINMLVAWQMEGECRLYKWERNFVKQITPSTHVAIGIGEVQALALLRDHRFTFTYKQMIFFAIRIMQKVKRAVQGCGGRTEVLYLVRDGQVGGVGRARVEFLEKFADDLDEYLLSALTHLITLPAESISGADTELLLAKCGEEFQRFRDEYLKMPM
jgi:20S proteasome alpha/beta subunit